MKRATSLFNQIVSYENVRLAWLKARKGKRSKPVVRNFYKNVNLNLEKVQKNLKSNPPVLSSYTQFTIFDPKERVISVVPFVDRVMHHAIMNVLEPVFERQFIFHAYACRKGKGSHKAVNYAFKKARNYKYFLKLDVRKYFDNIDHTVLKKLLSKIIKDVECLNLLFSLIDSYGMVVSTGSTTASSDSTTASGKGLPIGNLTSQFFANYYLSLLDHYVLEQLKPCGYVRYMDDFLLFDDSKEKLKIFLTQIENFCKNELILELKPPVLGNCKNGASFLGYLIKSDSVKLTQKSRRRKLAKLKRLNYELKMGWIDEEEYITRVCCMYAVSKVNQQLTVKERFCILLVVI